MSSMESLKSPWARYWLSFQPDTPQQGFLLMHLFGAFELEISPALPTARHPSGLPSCATPGARMGACLSLRSAHPLRKWKARSIPCRTSSTRSENEPAESSRSPDTMKVVPPRGAQKPHRSGKA
jgi:hypothetical protein